MVGKGKQQESHSHHGDQVHWAVFLLAADVSRLSAAAKVRAGPQALNKSAVANHDYEEREDKAEGKCHIVKDQNTLPGGEARGLETAKKAFPTSEQKERQKMIKKCVFRQASNYVCGEVMQQNKNIPLLAVYLTFWTPRWSGRD